MDFSSFPKYPVPREAGAATRAPKYAQNISLRGPRILLDLLLLACIVVLLYELRWATARTEHPQAPPPQPLLDFRLVVERYGQSQELATLQEIEELLGPPTHRKYWGPEVQELDRIGPWWPMDRHWAKWADPENEGRFVVILFAEDRVLWRHKQGF